MIDKNEAPEGYEAIDGYMCSLCCFGDDGIIACCLQSKCLPSERKDGENVVFKKIELDDE